MFRKIMLTSGFILTLLLSGCRNDSLDNMSMHDAKMMYNALSPSDKETVKGCVNGSLSVVDSVLTCTLD